MLSWRKRTVSLLAFLTAACAGASPVASPPPVASVGSAVDRASPPVMSEPVRPVVRSTGEVTWAAEGTGGEKLPLRWNTGIDEYGAAYFPVEAVKTCHARGLEVDASEAGSEVVRVMVTPPWRVRDARVVDSVGLSKLTRECVVRAVAGPLEHADAGSATGFEAKEMTVNVYVGLH